MNNVYWDPRAWHPSHDEIHEELAARCPQFLFHRHHEPYGQNVRTRKGVLCESLRIVFAACCVVDSRIVSGAEVLLPGVMFHAELPGVMFHADEKSPLLGEPLDPDLGGYYPGILALSLCVLWPHCRGQMKDQMKAALGYLAGILLDRLTRDKKRLLAGARGLAVQFEGEEQVPLRHLPELIKAAYPDDL